MKIKRLEISGFKSFADKVVLEFQQNVTAVVGPNGCGKSNVVDAIRWCMGEQSAKNLRGRGMEDLIFAGSEVRKPLGVAEVSLVFSTEDGRPPAKYLDYAEIQLTRRLYRDGESEYLINKNPCRLLDITELFMDTGVGTRAYSIIEQGKIGQILHSRPEERRFLVEEAAGVTKFKARKHLALKKIENTRHNLARLADVLGEIRRQLGSLQRQAKKAEKFREYRDELREKEILFTAIEYRDLIALESAATARLVALNEEVRLSSAAVAINETNAEAARIALLEAENRLGASQEELFRLRSEQGVTTNTLEFRKKEAAALDSRLARLASEVEDLKQRSAECGRRREELNRQLASGTAAALDVELELEQTENALKILQELEEQQSHLSETSRRDLFTVLTETSRLKARQESLHSHLSMLSDRRSRLEREALQFVERCGELAVRRGEMEAEITSSRQNHEALSQLLGGLTARAGELRQQLPAAEKRWHSHRDELNRGSSRLASLLELERQFAGYGGGVRSLMGSPEQRTSFSGVLADSVAAPPELEAALEAALADRLECLLCHGEEWAVRALGFLNATQGGRAGIALPLTSFPDELPPPPGALPLVSLVRISGTHAALVANLLTGVMLVDDMTTALRMASRDRTLTFVTPAGERVVSGGIVYGGSLGCAQGGLIRGKREIRELEASVAKLEAENSTLASFCEDIRNQCKVVDAELGACSRDLHQAELHVAGLQKDYEQTMAEIARLEERLHLHNHEQGSIAEERLKAESELEELGGELAVKVAAASEGEKENLRLKSVMEKLKSELSLLRDKLSSAKVQSATLKGENENTRRSLGDIERQIEEITQRTTVDILEEESGTAARLELESGIAAAAGQLSLLVSRQIEAEGTLAYVRGEYEAAAEKLGSAERLLKNCREENEAARQQHGETTLELSRLKMKGEHLAESLYEKSRISLSEALARLESADFDAASGRERQLELKRLLDEIGEVNLMAIEECEEIEGRSAFLSGQRDDLEESLRSLQQAIQRINRTTRQRFLETYNLINAKFQEVFPRLFCGGHAELRLTNEEDMLETGIDIVVQPPGKKLQNVMLLSGGEKALTAVALIFSIFLIKPTPFCLLDEVDAPLDDANIGRFNEMVREMSETSQFIIITHNKATMQVADTLYGITMEEPGASKVVSVRLH